MTQNPQTRAVRSRARATAPGRRSEHLVAAGAVAATAAFTAGGVLTQLVIVPQWRAMDPQTFLQQFASAGPATGAVLFPLKLASVVLLGVATTAALRRGRPGRRAWALATAGMVGTVVLLPVYFAGANAAMLDPAFPLEAVPAELTAWYGWNWLRTGLAVAATVLGVSALAATRADSAETVR